ncbi:MAG: hypothetical protein ACYTFG_05605, partial [Planctomycetota bacterium]
MLSKRTRPEGLLLAACCLVALVFSCSSEDDSHTHNAAEITSGTLSNDRLSTGPGGGLDADSVDGSHAVDFATAVHAHANYSDVSHNHDAVYLRLTGGTLTGALTLPSDGLTAGTNQLVLSGGNVGIGTASPTSKLEVVGTILAQASTGYAVRGQTSDPNASGIYGNSSAGHGVEGVSSGANKNGVYGSASGSHGVYGVTTSASHSGVYGSSGVGDAITGQCTGGGSGVVGTTTDPNFAGVNGQSTAGIGVYGQASATNMSGLYGLGMAGYGAIGETQNNTFAGVHGFSQVGDGVHGTTQAIATNWGVLSNGDLGVNGNIQKTGTVSFVERHPQDETKAIVYVCLEGGEAGTYCRGKSELVSGFATVALPDHFRHVTAKEGITVQITPSGPCNGLYVESFDNESITVRELMNGTGNVAFHYTVNGVRVGYENYDPVTDSE